MTMKRLRFFLFTIPVCLISVLIIGAQRPYPATAGGVIDPTCTSSLPCIEYDNNGTGPGVKGVGVAGNGLWGSTKNHSTFTNGRAGLFGNDIGTGGFNSGVRGLSVNGTGVSGQSTNAVGVAGTGLSYGVLGDAPSGVGVGGRTSSGLGVRGDGGTNGTGVYGQSTNGTGVSGKSFNFVGINAVGGFFNSSTNDDFPALSIVGNNAGGAGNNALIFACSPGTANPCDSFNNVFAVDGAGNVSSKATITAVSVVAFGGVFNIDGSGSYEKNGFCVAGCTVATATSAGRAVTTYASMVSQPTIEDFGEAQLVNGQATVRLDPKFANVVEQSANYLVFITPEGEANVLYVTQKSAGGFSVREIHGGRSTIAFSYRIVAKPFGSREARLPMVELPKLRSSSPKQPRRFHA